MSGMSTGIQKGIFHIKALPFITVMEHHVRHTGVAAAICRTVFFMNSFIFTAITQRGIDEILLDKCGVLAAERIITEHFGTGKKRSWLPAL